MSCYVLSCPVAPSRMRKTSRENGRYTNHFKITTWAQFTDFRKIFLQIVWHPVEHTSRNGMLCLLVWFGSGTAFATPFLRVASGS
jgi:hypothetical protein